MACPTKDDALLFRKMKADGEPTQQIANKTGFHRDTVRRYLKQDPVEKPDQSIVSEDRNSFSESGNDAVASLVTDKPIKSLEDAVAAAEVDLSIWYVDRWECTQWTTGMKIGTADDKRAIQQQQYRVKVWLKRLMPRSLQLATDAIFERMAKAAPKYPKLGNVKTSGEAYLAVVACFDVHMGKLAWAPETGNDYDLKIAEAVFKNAIEDLIAENQNRQIEKFIFPVGQDYYQVDSRKNETAAGTLQDADGRYAKIIETGEMAAIWAIERLASIAPVHVPWVPGNHDTTTSFHLARTAAAWFRNSDRVTVDAGATTRKYIAYGKNLIGITHGDQEKIDDLPNLMATERSADWSQCPFREWLLGHQHRSRAWVTKTVDSSMGTTIRVLKALTFTDAWHYKRGYIAGPNGQAAEIYWYSKDRGYSGHGIAAARTS